MAEVIPHGDLEPPANYSLARKISNSLFFSPSTPEEIHNVIPQFNATKATRSDDNETKFITCAIDIVSDRLSQLYSTIV